MGPPVPCRGRGVVTVPGVSCQEGHLWNPSSALSLSFDIPGERGTSLGHGWLLPEAASSCSPERLLGKQSSEDPKHSRSFASGF